MQFDLKGRIKMFAEQLRGEIDRADEDVIMQELGDEGFDILCNIVNKNEKITEQDFEKIKASYINAQNNKFISPSFWADGYFFKYFTDKEFKEMEKAQLE